MNCTKKEKNFNGCSCNYDQCLRKGACCECVAYHRSQKDLPACLRDQPDDILGS